MPLKTEEEKKIIAELEWRKKKLLELARENEERISRTDNFFKPTLILSYRFLKLRKMGKLSQILKQKQRHKSVAFMKRIQDAEREASAQEQENNQQTDRYTKINQANVAEEKKLTMLHLLEYQKRRNECLIKLKRTKPHIRGRGTGMMSSLDS
jgi:hypothetical protein